MSYFLNLLIILKLFLLERKHCLVVLRLHFLDLYNHFVIVVNPENSMLLENAMKKIYLDEELAEKFGNNARKRFDDLFTADKMGSSYLDVYEKLIETT